jgi:hypothetical protein
MSTFRADLTGWLLTAIYPEGMSEEEELLIDSAALIHEDRTNALRKRVEELEAENKRMKQHLLSSHDCDNFAGFEDPDYGF